MCGIGKTTLAKAVLVKIRSQLDFCCFVEDLKGRLKRHNVHLHNVVAENLYFGSGRKVHLHDGDAQSLWFYLLENKVLLIVDDVEYEDQIGSLLSTNWMGEGSRIIVTSRIRNRAQMPTFAICEVSFLSNDESEILFLAQLDTGVTGEIPKEVIQKVVLKCDGLPLTLEVIGSYLPFEKNVGVWTSALDKLSKAESLHGTEVDRLWAKLRIGIDDLAKLERGMFLDVAVFDECDPYTEQYDLETWEAVWETGLYGLSVDSDLRNLVDRSLVVLKVNVEYGEDYATQIEVTALWIHEQLRDLGRSMCRPYDTKIELCSRVWRKEDITTLLSMELRLPLRY